MRQHMCKIYVSPGRRYSNQLHIFGVRGSGRKREGVNIIYIKFIKEVYVNLSVVCHNNKKEAGILY